MNQHPDKIPPALEHPKIRSIDDLLTPDEQASLDADLSEMARQRALAAGSAALHFF